jgi:ABC-2 type transport system permease protein
MSQQLTGLSPGRAQRPGAQQPGRINREAFASLSQAMFRGFVRDRAALFFSLIFPVFFLVIFGSVFRSTGTPQVSVLEIGHVSLLDSAVKASPHQLGKVLTIKKTTDEASALDQVRKGSYDAAVLQRGSTLVVRYSAANPTTAGLVNSVMSSVVQQANLAATHRPPAFRMAASQVENKSLKSIQYLTPGLLGWAIASGGVFGAAITLVNWREHKLLRRLRLAPVSTAAVVTARIWVSIVIGLVQMAIFLAIATTPFFGLKLTAAWWMSVPLIICGTLAFLSIGLLVGAFAKTQQAATSIANLIILPMAFLGGSFIPLDFAPAWIRQVSYVMPLRYLVTGMQDVMARGEGPAAALPAIGVLLAFAAVLTLIAVRVFRWDDI